MEEKPAVKNKESKRRRSFDGNCKKFAANHQIRWRRKSISVIIKIGAFMKCFPPTEEEVYFERGKLHFGSETN